MKVKKIGKYAVVNYDELISVLSKAFDNECLLKYLKDQQAEDDFDMKKEDGELPATMTFGEYVSSIIESYEFVNVC